MHKLFWLADLYDIRVCGQKTLSGTDRFAGALEKVVSA